MTIRFERDGPVGSIVLANPPFNGFRICEHRGGFRQGYRASHARVRRQMSGAKKRNECQAVG